MTRFRFARAITLYTLVAVVLLATVALSWLRWESHRPRDAWFADRHGAIASVRSEASASGNGQLAESVRLTSDSGLAVSFRVIRKAETGAPLTTLLILGGHRTGRDAVDLFGDVGQRAVVGVDYPYDGPDKVKGIVPVAKTLPEARRAILDTVPAVSLVIDWLAAQAWVDRQRIVIIGASLGVPFASAAAARDERIAAAILIHGAAESRIWLERQLQRRIGNRVLHYPLSVVLYWLAYGPVLDAGKHIAEISPRPVLVVGARNDERTPAGQAELLFELAHEPRRLRFTEGQHVQPNRTEIVDDLLRIADEELFFLVP